MKSIILFPGQGAQYLGMAKKLLVKSQNTDKIKQIYEIASNVFKRDLLDLCINGPKEELDKTVNCQAAVFCTSLAYIELLKEKDRNIIANCIGTAGFSVGEYAALVFSGALKFENG
jgi:[acyl-carrier-protein] S-malonyltransferase